MGISDREATQTLDGHRLQKMIAASLAWLRQHQDVVNALNVFPVPDGDTGTNMTLTMTSAWEEIVDVDEPHAARLMSSVAHGALMGARGNSGVILSQILRGFAHGLDGHRTITMEVLAEAMRVATDTAYKGVVKPVEGTILTVVRELAEESSLVAEETKDLTVAFERLVKRGRHAVDRTPSLLPVLRQAGVVDAGGEGLYVIFEGMLRDLKGLPVTDVASPEASTFAIDRTSPQAVHDAVAFDSAYPYDVQYILIGQGLDVPRIRADIEAMGDSALAVGDDSTIKVHVHVEDPGRPISYAARFGSVQDVVVEDMRVQYEAYVAAREEQQVVSQSPELPVALLVPERPPEISVVVVAAGEGLNKVFRSLGATAVVEGGQTMNPSTAQILEAIEQAKSDKVIILPNNKNVLMAAEQAAEVSQKDVAVVPTRSIPQGVSALLALDQDSSLADNTAAMIESSTDVVSGEITWATRDVKLNGLQVKGGDAIGLLEDELVVDAQNVVEAVQWLLAEVDMEDRELVTLYYGESITDPEAHELADALAEAYPELEFEVVAGGQPHYPYLISVE